MPAATAAVLICIVVGITDGDTLTTRCDTSIGVETMKVRLAEVDAPEKAQPFGNRSKEHLARVCFNRVAEVRPQATDRYGRIVAQVTCEGANANREQVHAGMAWVFDRYVTDRGLYDVQDEARAARRGLWADSLPVAPWLWRRRVADQR